MGGAGWPVELADGAIGVRPIRLRDGPAWAEVRRRNEAWLSRWESTPPDAPRADIASLPAFTAMVRALRRQARGGEALPFAVTYDGLFVGQLTLGNIVRGSLNSAYAGYWIDERFAGQGVVPTALALVVDHSFGRVGLHRIEANVRQENTASRRVVEKLGFREEGLRLRYLHIDGAYRDHICYAITVEEVPGGLLRRWRARQST